VKERAAKQGKEQGKKGKRKSHGKKGNRNEKRGMSSTKWLALLQRNYTQIITE
jgi:hypothetical protein